MQREYIINYSFNRAVQLRFNGAALFRRNRQGAVSQAAGPFRGGEHDAAHTNEIRFLILTATRLPGQSPAADRVLDMIPAAARHEHWEIKLEQPFEDFHYGVVGHAQVRQRITRQSVQTEFQHEHVRSEGGRQWHCHGIKRRQKGFVVSLGRQGNVDIVTASGAFADFIFKTAPRVKRLAGFMQ